MGRPVLTSRGLRGRHTPAGTFALVYFRTGTNEVALTRVVSGVWMGFAVDFFEPVDAYVGINLSAGEAFMAEEFLDDA